MPTITVSATHLAEIANVDLTKFRERNANSVQYLLTGHTPLIPQTCTITVIPPSPRPGNNGTVKTTINVHKNEVLYAGTDQERVVPIVGKLEMSVPVGVETYAGGQGNLEKLLHTIGAFTVLGDSEAVDLYETGILPE